MLDTIFFSSIIYIWYEGGERKPPLVRYQGSRLDGELINDPTLALASHPD